MILFINSWFRVTGQLNLQFKGVVATVIEVVAKVAKGIGVGTNELRGSC